MTMMLYLSLWDCHDFAKVLVKLSVVLSLSSTSMMTWNLPSQLAVLENLFFATTVQGFSYVLQEWEKRHYIQYGGCFVLLYWHHFLVRLAGGGNRIGPYRSYHSFDDWKLSNLSWRSYGDVRDFYSCRVRAVADKLTTLFLLPGPTVRYFILPWFCE